jgi:hypothetical protein
MPFLMIYAPHISFQIVMQAARLKICVRSQECNTGIIYVVLLVDNPSKSTAYCMHCVRRWKEPPPGAELTRVIPKAKLQRMAPFLEAAERWPEVIELRGRRFGDERPHVVLGNALPLGELELSKARLLEELELIDAVELLEAIEKYGGKQAVAGLAVKMDAKEPARQAQRAKEVHWLVFTKGHYVQFNQRSYAKRKSKLAGLCEEQRDGEFHFEYTSRPTTTLVLLGTKDAGTGFHCDRSDAKNCGFGVLNSGRRNEKVGRDYLARWDRIHRERVPDADAWV